MVQTITTECGLGVHLLLYKWKMMLLNEPRGLLYILKDATTGQFWIDGGTAMGLLNIHCCRKVVAKLMSLQ